MTVSAKKMRRDFEKIFTQNLVTAKLVNESNLESGEYFHENEDNSVTKTDIVLNIQAVNYKQLKLMEMGYLEQAEYHCYVRYNTDYDETQEIEIDETLASQTNIRKGRYKIVNSRAGIFNGVLVFKEFDLQFKRELP